MSWSIAPSARPRVGTNGPVSRAGSHQPARLWSVGLVLYLLLVWLILLGWLTVAMTPETLSRFMLWVAVAACALVAAAFLARLLRPYGEPAKSVH